MSKKVERKLSQGFKDVSLFCWKESSILVKNSQK